MTEITPDKIYVEFPPMARVSAVPYEVQQWLLQNIGNDVEWGVVNGMRVGVFLSSVDAIAFKLRFSI